MSDDPKPIDPPAPPSPAVHSDELWGGPRFIKNATGIPVWVETKEQYWALLNRHGLRMEGQQESTTGPEQEKEPEPIPLHLTPPPPVPPMLKAEAEVYGAITAVLRRYDIGEVIACEHCFSRNVPDGCSMSVTSRAVQIRCRCGLARYEAPTGTTDLVLSRIANTTITAIDHTSGTIITPGVGEELRPTTLLLAQEVLLIQAYVRALLDRGKEPHWFHHGCWSGNPMNRSEAVAMKVSSAQCILVCQCRMLFWQDAGAIAMPTRVM